MDASITLQHSIPSQQIWRNSETLKPEKGRRTCSQYPTRSRGSRHVSCNRSGPRFRDAQLLFDKCQRVEYAAMRLLSED